MLYYMAMRAWVIPAIVLVAVVMGISAIAITMQEAEAQSTITNVGLASGQHQIDGNLVAFRVLESGEGPAGTDLNGDGDTSDLVIHVFDTSTPLSPTNPINVGLAASVFLRIDGNLVVFTVSESGEGPAGTDLNLDGDTSDNVLHVFDTSTPLSGTNPINVGLSTSSVVIDGNLVVFTVLEPAEGPAGTDLNGDGDTSDIVLHVFDTSTPLSGTNPINVGLAAAGFQIDGNLVAFQVSESAQGFTILNGDGDTSDIVLHVFDTSTPLSGTNPINVGLSTTLPRIDGNLVAFRVSESAQGFTILNGDGDTSDFVLHVFDSSTSITTNVGFATLSNFGFDGNLVAFRVSESQQGTTSLNGDVDTSDAVIHVFDSSTSTTTNVGLAASAPRIDGNLVVFRVTEFSEGATDLNGDGDAFDNVLHVFDTSTPLSGTNPINVGFATNFNIT